jgi:hypothetical protein
MSTQPNSLAAAIPGLTDKQIAVVQAMGASGLTHGQLMKAIAVYGNLTLHAAEQGKQHPLRAGFGLSAPDFASLIAHLKDGGGVADDSSDLGGGGLAQLFWDEVHATEPDQATVASLGIELLKSYGLIRGKVKPAASGTGVMWSGVGPRIVQGPKELTKNATEA